MKLKDIVIDMHQGINTVADKVEYQNEGIPIIQSKNFTKGFLDLEDVRYLGPKDEEKYIDKYNPHVGDILMANIGTIGKSYVITEELKFLIAWNAFLIKVNQNLVMPNFLKFLFDYLANTHYFDALLTGGTVKFINKKKIGEINIPNLNLDKQREICKKLSVVENIIIQRNKELELLDDLIKARFVEMFGDPETNPMGWEKVTLGDVCSSIVRGPFGSALKKEFFVEPSDNTYKVYEQKHAIQKSSSIGTYYVTEEKYQELKRFECLSGDIIMSCSGTMGELYQLPAGCEKGIINQALCKFTLNDKILPICFLVYMKQTIRNLETKGSGIKNIAAVSYVKQMPINLPPMNVQKEFETFCKQVDKSKVVA